jgi:hemolysin-activating ACP:hemolysin acyltransferase
MATDNGFDRRKASGIRICLYMMPGDEHPEARHERVLQVLASALLVIQNGSCVAWSIRPVPYISWAYDVTPMEAQAVSDEDTRTMIAALRDQPQIAFAELLDAD